MYLIIYRWGLKIKKRMGKVEQWAEKQGLELAAGMYSTLYFTCFFNIFFFNFLHISTACLPTFQTVT